MHTVQSHNTNKYLLLASFALSVRQVMDRVFLPFMGQARGLRKKTRTEETKLIRCLLYGFVAYSRKGTHSFDVFTELEVRPATYGPEIA